MIIPIIYKYDAHYPAEGWQGDQNPAGSMFLVDEGTREP